MAKVASKLQPTQKHCHLDDGDTPMGGDDRFEEFEQRIQHLEHSLAEQQAKQDSQHADVTGQIGQIRHQVDQQSTTMQQHFDNKMAEQLNHIERLLNAREAKKHRAE